MVQEAATATVRQMLSSVRPYGNAGEGAPRLVLPQHELIFLTSTNYTQLEARRCWGWGLFVPQQALLDCVGIAPHFFYLYEFSDGSFLGRVFHADPVEMAELSHHNKLLDWRGQTGWDIPFRRWSVYLSPEG